MKKYGIISNPHSPVWVNAEHTLINLVVTIDGHNGEHQFTATASDPEEYGSALFADAVAEAFGPIADYTPPPAGFFENLVRGQRDQLLARTDWTQLPDVPQTIKDLWAPYRQALRDVPQQEGFPENIVWPTPPA